MKNPMNYLIQLASLSLLCVWSGAVSATIVEYNLQSLGGNSYAYEYTVTNDTSSVIEEFSTFFDFNNYENLAVGAAPVGWDPIVLQPDTGIPDDGVYDALALAGGIAAGNSLGGFVVTFDWLGAGTPGVQGFETYDINFRLIDDGTTAVPEPSIALLLVSALVLLRRKA